MGRTFNRRGLALMMLVGAVQAAGRCQEADSGKGIPQMLATDEGFIAIEPPKGWLRSQGPGLATFLREGDNDWQSAEVRIYINTSSAGSKQSVQDFVKEDIAGFRARFKKATVKQEEPIKLTHIKSQVLVWTFQSNEEYSAFERLAYSGEPDRVLILALSANSKALFEQSLPVFVEFVKSYRGTIWFAPEAKKP